MTNTEPRTVELGDGATVRVSVDRQSCVGSGMCNQLVPGLFVLDADGTSFVSDPGHPVDRDDVEQAADVCPVAAIDVVEGD